MPEPQIGVAYEFSLALIDTATGGLRANPTLATGDVKISKDHGAFANVATLPTVSPAAGVDVKVPLSATEMTVTGQVDLHFKDAAGAEWDDVFVTIQPVAHLGADSKVLLSTSAQTGVVLPRVTLTDTVTTYTGNTPQTGDSFARLGAPAGASVSADILVLDNLVDDLESRVGTPSNLGGGATIAFNLSDIEAQTDDIGAAGAGLTAINLPNQTMDIIGTITGNITGNLSGSVGSVTGAVGSVTGAVGSVATGGIAAASFAAGAIDAAAIAVDAIGSSELAASAVTEIQTAVGVALTEAQVRSAVGLAAANLDTQLGAIDDFLDTEVLAIKAKTDALPTDPADASDIAAAFASLAATLSTIAGYLDTEVAAIKAQTDLIPASPAAVGSAMTLAANAIAAATLAADALAAVKTQVTDALAVDTYAEPGQGSPAATSSLATKLGYLYKVMRNRITSTNSTIAVYNDASTVVDQKATQSDDGLTFEREKFTTGP